MNLMTPNQSLQPTALLRQQIPFSLKEFFGGNNDVVFE